MNAPEFPQSESWFYRTLTEQPAFLASVLYVFASAIGLFYSWSFLRPFGINMLQYAEISDFLLASIKEPLTWVLVLLAVTAIQLDNVMSRGVQAREPGRLLRWYGSDRCRKFNYLVLFMLVAVLLFVYADLKVRNVLEGGADVYEVRLADGSPSQPRALLGTTVNFIFLYDAQSGDVYIHPNENVLSMSKRVPGDSVGEPSAPGDPES